MVDGGAIHCLTWDLEDTAKPVLLLLHGFWGHAHWWDFIAPFFRGRYRIVAPDFSGMGDSVHRSRYELLTFDRDIVGVLEGLGLEQASVVAHSFGGTRLLRACAEHPGLFRHAVIVDSYVHFPVEDGPMPPPEPVKGTRIYPDPETAIARFRLTPPQRFVLPYLVEHIARHSLRQVADGWRWKFDAAMPLDLETEFDGPALLARIDIPVDQVYGMESRVVSAERARMTMAHLPCPGQLVAIPGSGHHVMLDHPLELIDALHTLLAQRRESAA